MIEFNKLTEGKEIISSNSESKALVCLHQDIFVILIRSDELLCFHVTLHLHFQIQTNCKHKLISFFKPCRCKHLNNKHLQEAKMLA